MQTIVKNVPAGDLTAVPSSTQTVALPVVRALFFKRRFVTFLNDVLGPHLKSICDLNYSEAPSFSPSFATSLS